MLRQELGTILGIWAHPDDEAYLSGGLMALASDAGARVVCVTATRGEHGTPDHRAVSAWATAAFAKAAPRGARLLHAAVAAQWEQRWSALHERFDVYLPGYPVTVTEEALAIDLTSTKPSRSGRCAG